MKTDKGYFTLPFLCGIAIICWLSAGLFTIGKTEINVINEQQQQKELQYMAEEQLLLLADKINNDDELEMQIKKSNGSKPIFTVQEEGKRCDIFGKKINDNLVLRGELSKGEVQNRAFLKLKWQEDKKKWIVVEYEN